MPKPTNGLESACTRGGVTRRQLLHGIGAALGSVTVARTTGARTAAAGGRVLERTAAVQTDHVGPYNSAVLPSGVRSRFVPNINGMTLHVLEAGFQTDNRPALLLLHGFPELAYSWRRVMVPLAEAGYHVIAPDQRGYGRTTGWDPDYDGDLRSYSRLNVVRDALALVSAFGYRTVEGVIGHDFGSRSPRGAPSPDRMSFAPSC